MKSIMESWRRLLKEFDSTEEELPQPLPPNEIPESLFYNTTFESLGNNTVNGLKDFSDENKRTCGEGVSFTSDFESATSNHANGNIILVFDGHGLAESGQYNFRPYDNPATEDERGIPEIKLEMIDSASDTGSGIDVKVETLGTEVPFKYVKKMVFLYKIPEAKQEWLRSTYPDISFESFNRANGDILEYEEQQP